MQLRVQCQHVIRIDGWMQATNDGDTVGQGILRQTANLNRHCQVGLEKGGSGHNIGCRRAEAAGDFR